METINIDEIEGAVLEFVKGRSAADIGYAIALLRAFRSGQGSDYPAPKPARGRPAGAKNRKKAATGGAEVAIEG